jgi:hypothetical protein
MVCQNIPIGEGPRPTSIKSIITFIVGFDVIIWCYGDRNNMIVIMLQYNNIEWREPKSLSPVGVPDGCTLIVEVNDLISIKSITCIIGFDVIVWCYDDRNDKLVIMLQHNIFNGESPISFCGGSSRWMYFDYGIHWSQWPNNNTSMYITHMCCIKGMFMTLTSGHDHYCTVLSRISREMSNNFISIYTRSTKIRWLSERMDEKVTLKWHGILYIFHRWIKVWWSPRWWVLNLTVISDRFSLFIANYIWVRL